MKTETLKAAALAAGAEKCSICVVGMVGTKKIPEGLWAMAEADFEKVIDDWNERTKRFAIPHPGSAIKFIHCPMCGHKVEG